MKKTVRIISVFIIFLFLAIAAFAYSTINMEEEILEKVRQIMENTKSKGMSSKYFSIGDPDTFIKKAESYLLGITVDTLYLSSLKDSPRGFCQPKDMGQLIRDMFQAEEERYDGWIILSEYPYFKNNKAGDAEKTAFHETIHAYHLAIKSDADEKIIIKNKGEKYDLEAPEQISGPYYEILMILKERIDPAIDKLLVKIKNGELYQPDLDNLMKLIEMQRNKMQGPGYMIYGYTPQFYECLKNIGGKCDWDGYIKEINAMIEQAKKNANFKDISVTIDYPEEIEVGKEFRIDAKCAGGTGKLTYEWKVPGGKSSPTPSVLAFIYTPRVEIFTFQVWDQGKYSKTSKKVDITIKAYAKITGSIAGPSETEPGKTISLKAEVAGGKAPLIYSWTDSAGKVFLGTDTFSTALNGGPGEIRTIILTVKDSLKAPQVLTISKQIKIIASKEIIKPQEKPEIIISKIEIVPNRVEAGKNADVKIHLMLKGFSVTPVPIKATIWLEGSSGGSASSKTGAYLCDRGQLRSITAQLPTKKDGKPGKIKVVVKIDAEGITKTAYAYAELVQKTEQLSVTLVSASKSISPGEIVNLKAKVTGGVKPYKYSWFLDQRPYVGEIHESQDNKARLTTPGDHIITVSVTDSNNPPATVKSSVTVTVLVPLTLNLGADRLKIKSGEKIVFTATVTGGSGKYKYAWFLDGTECKGCNSPSVTYALKGAGIHKMRVAVFDILYPAAKKEGVINITVEKAVSTSTSSAATEKPKIVITKFEISPSTIKAGKKAKVTATFHVNNPALQEIPVSSVIWMSESCGGKAVYDRRSFTVKNNVSWEVSAYLPTRADAKAGPIDAVVRIDACGLTQTARAKAVIVKTSASSAKPAADKSNNSPASEDPFVGSWEGYTQSTYCRLNGKVYDLSSYKNPTGIVKIEKQGSVYTLTLYYNNMVRKPISSSYVEGNKITFKSVYKGSTWTEEYTVNGNQMTGTIRDEEANGDLSICSVWLQKK